MSDRDDSDTTDVLVWAATFLIPPVTFLLPVVYYGWRPLTTAVGGWRSRRAIRRAIAARQAEERRHRLAAEAAWRALPPPPPPPPVPTTDELRTAARARYEAALRALDAPGLTDAERHAGAERAKQAYLRDLDRLIGA